MASTGMAPEIGTLPLLARLSRASFLDVAPSISLQGEAAQRWPGHGLKYQPWPCRGAYVGDSGCSPTMLTSDTPECEAFVEQLPFKMYDVLKFSVFSTVAEDPETYMRTRFDSLVSSLFAKELVDGAGSGGLSLSSEAHHAGGGAFGGTAVDLKVGLAAIEEDLADNLNGGQGMIHIHPGMLSQAVGDYELEWDGSNYITPVGNLVIADAGYHTMAHPADASAPGSKKAYIYGSGPVFWAYSEPEFLGEMLDGGSFATSRNTITRFIEGYGIVLFDPCAVTSILVNYVKSA